jgi:hypothetical protein
MRVFVALLCLIAGAALAVTVAQATKVKLLVRSDPPGIIATAESNLDSGSAVIIPPPPDSSNGYTFAYWYLKTPSDQPADHRKVDDYGMSTTALSFKIYENTEYIALYVPSNQDTGNTGVPDWYRLRNYGTVDIAPYSDTDGDKVTLLEEYRKGSLPLIPDSAEDGGIVQGGISRRRGAKIPVVVDPNFFLYTETSIPPGIVNRSQYVASGNRIRSATAQQEIQGYHFAQWRVNGVRQENDNGIAQNQILVYITGNTNVVAEYVPSKQDTGNTGIPDWYRLNQYGTINIDPSSDTDGDERTLAQEYADGTQPRIYDNSKDAPLLEGGISRRRGAKLPLPFSPAYVHYLESSDPPGILSRDVYLTTGTSVTTANAPAEINGYKFTQWSINGVRQEADAGFAKSRATFTLTGDTRAIAHYMLTTVDTDRDVVPDWYEMLQYGDLTYDASSDTDKDGVSLLAEYLMGSQPRIPDSAADGGILEGGVSRRRGAKMVLNLQFFPASQTAQSSGGGFFNDPYSGAKGGFKMDSGGSFPAIGDFDGDGDLDLFVGGAGGSLRIFKNTGSPFAPELSELPEVAKNLSALKDWPTGNVYPALGDWSKEGKPDLVVGSDDGKLRFYRAGNTTGVFEWVTTLTVAGASDPVHPGFWPKQAGLDLLVLNGATGKVLRFEAISGSPSFPYVQTPTENNLLGADNAITNGTGISITDTNGDGIADLIASDTDGRIWRFLGKTDGSFTLESKVYGGAYNGFYPGLSAAVVDFDGDGSPDIIGGGSDGGLVFLRNPGRHLRLSPAVVTVRAGETISFSTIDDDGTLTWKMGPNQSGGKVIGNGTYTAGANTGVDEVVALDSSGHVGVAWVNILPAEKSANGHANRALLVDGRRDIDDDSVSLASQALVKYARKVLRYRGLTEDEILWLGHGREADAKPTRNALKAALFEGGAVDASTEKLTIYLADHGRIDEATQEGVFLLAKNETVSASELNDWLNHLQDSHPKLSIVILTECCFGGSVTGKMAQEGAYSHRRLVLSSSGPREPAYLASNGSVSYSMNWWSSLAAGKSIREAHNSASESMKRLQKPQISDGGDTLADAKLGLEVASAGRPVVNLVGNSPMALQGNQTAQITVDVDSARPLEKVTAVVVPPGYSPSTDAPVTGLKEIELALDDSTGLWTATADGFSETGAPYIVMIQAKDIWGQASTPATLQISQEKLHNKFLVLATAQPDSNAIGRTLDTALMAVGAASDGATGVQATDIKVLMENNMRPIDGISGINSLGNAIRGSNVDGDLAILNIFLVGQGSPEGLVCANGEVITPANLKEQLDDLQKDRRVSVQIVVDADYSGIFVEGTANPSKNRQILCSTSADARNDNVNGEAWCSTTGWLLQGFAQGRNVRKSFEDATRYASLVRGVSNSQLDDNSDGRSNTPSDGVKASQSHFKSPYETAEDPPFIGKASAAMSVASGEAARFWISNVIMPDGKPPAAAWGQVFGPDGTPRGTVRLARNESKGLYEGSFNGFVEPGRYQIVVQAGELNNPRKMTPPAIIQVFYATQITGTGPATGTLPVMAMPTDGQLMVVDKDTNAQWNVSLQRGQRIVIEAIEVSSQRDVSLQLVGADNNVIAQADRWGKGFGETISDWEVLTDGKYIIRATFAPGRGGATCKVRTHVKYDAGDDIPVQLAPQVITFAALPDRALSDGPLTLSASSSSGLPVRFELASGSANLSGNILTPTNAGNLVLRALQNGNSKWESAIPVTRSLIVTGTLADNPTDTSLTESYDTWAQRIFGATYATQGVRTQDADGDGQSNEAEWLARTDPTSAQDVLRIQTAHLTANGFTLGWQGRSGVKYRVMQSRDLAIWVPIDGATFSGTGALIEFNDPRVEEDSKFYRVEVVP